MFSRAGALRLVALFLCRAQTARSLVHNADGSSPPTQLAPALNGSKLRRSGEIAGWTKFFSCDGEDATNRLLFTTAEVMSMASASTRVKYCLYGSTTNCLTSVANAFPIAMLRLGYTMSHNNGAPCGSRCVAAAWEDDDPSTGLEVVSDLWNNCGSWTTGALMGTGSTMLYQSCNNGNGLHVSVNDNGRCCWRSATCYQGSDADAGVEMYVDIPAPSTPPTSSPTTASPTSSPTTASPTSSPTLLAPTSFGDPHVSNLRGERFDVLSPGDFVYLSIPRGATAAAGGGATLLHIVAKVEPLGRLCQEGLLFVTGLELSGQWVLGGRVRSLALSTSVQAKMEAQALKIRLLQEEQEVPGAAAGGGNSRGSVVARDLSASELAAEFGPGTGLMEVTEYKPKALPGAINQHVTVMLLKLKLGPTMAKVRMVQQREKDDEAGAKEAEEETENKVKKIDGQAAKGRLRFSNSLWLTVTGLEGVLQGGGRGATDIGGILGFDDHSAATQAPGECPDTNRADKQRIASTGGGGVHAMVALGHGAPADDELS